MSSVRAERRLPQRRARMIDVDRRALAVVALACAGLFALSFLFGRALSPGRGASEGLPAFAATQASAEIPVSLSAAPAIKLGAPVAATVPAKTPAPPAPAVTSAPLATSPPATAPALTQPPTPPQSTAPATVQPSVATAPAKTPARTPASSRPAGGGSGAKPGGSVSFDSSG